MKNYYRIRLGQTNRYAGEGLKGNFIGVDYGIKMDLANQLPEDWREFNKKFIPIYLQNSPEKTKVAAGLACGAVWTVAKGISNGDVVLCPDGTGSCMVGEVLDTYSYHSGEILPHRRTVRWYPKAIDKADMSEALQNMLKAIGTIHNITRHGDEIEKLIAGSTIPPDPVEDPYAFALEKHLEDFLVQNWGHTELGRNYTIFEVDGEPVGQQFQTDTGNIDVLAISKNKKELLVVELKRGRASDNVVGQIQRYMGYVKEELAEEGQAVKGVIIALEDDLKIRRALSVTGNIEFYRYQVSFKLFKNSDASREK